MTDMVPLNYKNVTIGDIEKVLDKLGGEEGVKKFLEGELVLTDSSKKAKKTLKPFLTLTTNPTTKEQLITDIKANKNVAGVADEVTKDAMEMMEDLEFTISKEVERVSFVALARDKDLGFTTKPRTMDFMNDKFCRAWSVENLNGYAIELCEPDDGPRIRRHWTNQPKGSTVICAMNRLLNFNSTPHIWSLECSSNGERLLNGSWAPPGMSLLNQDDPIVFRLHKFTRLKL